MASRANRLRVAIVGAGNVAWGLAPALIKGGEVDIIRVASRTEDSARLLAEHLGPGVEATTDLSRADKGADLVIVAASDSAIASIAASCPGSGAIWAHTSGSVDMGVLKSATDRCGVIYPMQTFTRGVAVDLSDSPIYIEASDESVDTTLSGIARSISSNVGHADSEGRRLLHCGAVFACNFVNHLWSLADSIARRAGGSFSDYIPLIEETIAKAAEIGPDRAQTGPARRGADAVMAGHEDLLPAEQKEIYRILSRSIINKYHQS